MSEAGDWQVDGALLEAWRKGDADAGAELYDRHVGAVARFVRNKLPDQAEELIQQTFLALVESRDRIRAGITVRAFLLGIARHKLLDCLAKLGKGRVIDPEADSIVDVAPGPSTLVARKREQKLLLEGLRRIPIEHQIALELFYWEGLSAAEIAEVFGISHSAMRSRLSKARALLEEQMATLAESPDLLSSTVTGFDGWVAEIRARM
ncbi:MAG: sigma-70 family RNA polymerase sigma factor [Deltaproteobacteria bacterium]|nr:sigma-70 family RNA polymerase sigma factor [Deltaproteobacteria bacterium]